MCTAPATWFRFSLQKWNGYPTLFIGLDLDGNSNPPKDATAQDPAKIVVHHGTSIFVVIFCLFYLFQGSYVAYLDHPT